MTTGKTIALTRRNYVGKVMSLLFNMLSRLAITLTTRTFVSKVLPLLFNMLSRLVIAFLPRGKHLLTSWLQSPSAEIFELPKIKSPTVSIVSPSTRHEVIGLDATRSVFLNVEC